VTLPLIGVPGFFDDVVSCCCLYCSDVSAAADIKATCIACLHLCYILFASLLLLASLIVQVFILLKASLFYFCYFCWQSILAAGFQTIAGVPAIVGLPDIAGISTVASISSVAGIAAGVPKVDGALLLLAFLLLLVF
jgi:hypothetical protein